MAGADWGPNRTSLIRIGYMQ